MVKLLPQMLFSEGFSKYIYIYTTFRDNVAYEGHRVLDIVLAMAFGITPSRGKTLISNPRCLAEASTCGKDLRR